LNVLQKLIRNYVAYISRNPITMIPEEVRALHKIICIFIDFFSHSARRPGLKTTAVPSRNLPYHIKKDRFDSDFSVT
jgi:hypothetical protein